MRSQNRSPNKLIEMLLLPARIGDRTAMIALADLYVKLDELPEAKKWLMKAVLRGDIDAMKDLAFLLEKENKISKAKEWYEKAARKGERIAILALGIISYRDEKNISNARTWFKKAAEMGHELAMFNLSVFEYRDGRYHDALELALKAVDHGCVRANLLSAR